MKKIKKTSLEELQEDSLDEGSIDHASYLTASDLQSDSDDAAIPTVTIITDRQAIESNLDIARGITLSRKKSLEIVDRRYSQGLVGPVDASGNRLVAGGFIAIGFS